MWIGLFSESEESDLDSFSVWVGEPIYVAEQIVKALEIYPWAAEVAAGVVGAALDRHDSHWDIFDEAFEQRLRVSFREIETYSAAEGS